MNKKNAAILIIITSLMAGCTYYPETHSQTDHYYINKDLYAVGKVAIVELENKSSSPQIAPDTTEAIFQAMQKKQIFSVNVVQQNDSAWKNLNLDINTKYDTRKFGEVQEALKCNAALLGTITHFQPFPHMAIGLRLKLIDLEDGKLLWALEQIWDTADKTTEKRIKKYFQYQVRSGYAPLREQVVTISTAKFVKFVAYEVSETMKPSPIPVLDMIPGLWGAK
jgi:hypothetical protein